VTPCSTSEEIFGGSSLNSTALEFERAHVPTRKQLPVRRSLPADAILNSASTVSRNGNGRSFRRQHANGFNPRPASHLSVNVTTGNTLRSSHASSGAGWLPNLSADDVADLQRKRQAEGLSGRQINAEVGTLRAILRHFGIWSHISGRIRMLRQRSDVGKALSPEDEQRLLDAIRQSRSPSLYPFFVLSIDAGLRPSETRALRRSNLLIEWGGGAIAKGEIVVGRSKTDAGTGRMIPLTQRACAALTLWLSRFPDANMESFVFPFHHVALAGNDRIPHIYGVNADRPMSYSSYRTAFDTARAKAGVNIRFYDARHTFVTRLAENPAVSEETIRQLAGHDSPRMLARYARIRSQARRDAIATLEPDVPADLSGPRSGSPQKSPQSPANGSAVLLGTMKEPWR
jgi:integrase